MLLQCKSQANGTSSLCKRHPSTSIMTFLHIGSTLSITEGARLFSTRTPSTPIFVVKSITLHDTRRELPDQVVEGGRRWVMQVVISRASFRRPPLWPEVLYSVVPTCTQYLRKKTGYCKKLILTIRAIMIGQQFDWVAGDFNGTAIAMQQPKSSSSEYSCHCD